jgi:hypothetical protein
LGLAGAVVPSTPTRAKRTSAAFATAEADERPPLEGISTFFADVPRFS